MRRRRSEQSREDEIRHAEQQLVVIDGMVDALRDPHLLLDILMQADDVDAANHALRAQFGFTDVQATAVLDQQFRRVTRLDRERLEQRRQELADHVAFLNEAETE